jgi:hypothetical protein
MNDLYDELYMEVIQILSEHFDATLDNVSSAAEEITTYLADKVEEEYGI